ncbi:CoA transferase [Hydrogenophaga intermedia]|nr:CoA transferase [Hydrogenophaga intermedia]
MTFLRVICAQSFEETPLSPAPDHPSLPLAGIRVAEFSHMVMGPMCGMVLADLGAEVIKVEPPAGDNTRRLLGSGAGFFPLFNRNKKSLVLDLQSEAGREAALRLVATADVLVENFKPETMRKLGLDHQSLKARFPRLIHVSHKGFLPGPYDHRTALDEVVQMMGGLAYMTGRPGDPLRAGSSVNDIMGGMFGAIGVMAALRERERTGRGQAVQSALFENNIFLVAQHMLQYAVTGAAANPMPQRISPWGIYDVFTAAGGEQIFLAVVSDTQWAIFCSAIGWSDWRDDPRLRTNNERVRARDWLLPELRARVAQRPVKELAELFERHGLPFAPIAKPHELLDDPHLRATGGLAPITLPDGERAGQTVQTVPLPFTLDDQRLPVHSPPRLGADSSEVLRELGYDDAAIERLSRTASKG